MEKTFIIIAGAQGSFELNGYTAVVKLVDGKNAILAKYVLRNNNDLPVTIHYDATNNQVTINREKGVSREEFILTPAY